MLQQELPSSTPCYIGRELTKLYEQIWTGTLDALAQAITEETIPQRGEFIVGLSLSKSTSDRWQEAALSLVQDLGVKKTSLWISEHFEVRKNQVYDFLTEVNRLK